MPRLTLYQMRFSRLPQVLGLCSDNTPAIAAAVNSSQERLMFAKEAGDEGWYGTFAEVLFNVLPTDPYITLTRDMARLEFADVCKTPVPVRNPFTEYLDFGNGYQPKYTCAGAKACTYRQIFDRLQVPMFRDLSGPNRILRVRALNPLDTQGNKRVFVSGTDNLDNPLISVIGPNGVSGIYLTLANPFVDVPVTLNSVTGIQKDQTYGQVLFSDVDPDTGNEIPCLMMEPSETVSGYRRYFLNGLPGSCCPLVKDASGNSLVQVQALVKLNFIPVQVDTDYLLIQSQEAIISEAQSMRYSTIDTPAAKAMADNAHKQAIRYLQGELAHHLGIDNPAVEFHPSALAGIERDRVGTMI